MYSVLKPLLFAQDPEMAHDLTIGSLKHTQRTPLAWFYKQRVVDKPVSVMGLSFKNPLGLAAGLDKNGECIDAFAAMGFGFIEIGTVTPRPQAGNDKPRMFRLAEAEGIINRMGFNNQGVDYLVDQVGRSTYDGILGINIGKNKDTPEHRALDDYLTCLRKVYPHASYVTVNISSPNTPGLRNLQHGQVLKALLDGLKQEQGILAEQHGKYVPIAVKIAPDLDDNVLTDIAQTLIETGMDGVIATNTTLDRRKVSGMEHAEEAGGLSGRPLTEKSQHVTEVLRLAIDGAIPIIGVGGIHSGSSAKARLAGGADLIQVYSALIYQGPTLVKQILEGL